MQDDEDLLRKPDDSYQQHEQDELDGEHDDKREDEQDNEHYDKQDDKQDDDQDDDQDDKQDKYDKYGERYPREDLQTGRYDDDDDDDLMESDRNQGEDAQADNERIDPDVFDVLERHQAKNGRRKAPSPSRLSSVTFFFHT